MVEVTVADDIFDNPSWPVPDWPPGGRGTYMKDPDFLVVGDDPDGAAAALHAAGERFMYVSDQGRELEPWEDNGAEDTPNFVSDVYLTDAGPYLYTDTKGEMTPEMGAAMLRILTEELLSRGVSAHISAARGGLELGDRTWSPPFVESEQVPEPLRAWFVIRTEWRHTTTGVAYEDCQYWTGRRWTHSKSDAQTWEEAPVDLVRRLREEPYRPYGEPTAVLFSVEPDEEPWPMPPRSIRGGGKP